MGTWKKGDILGETFQSQVVLLRVMITGLLSPNVLASYDVNSKHSFFRVFSNENWGNSKFYGFLPGILRHLCLYCEHSDQLSAPSGKLGTINKFQ